LFQGSEREREAVSDEQPFENRKAERAVDDRTKFCLPLHFPLRRYYVLQGQPPSRRIRGATCIS